MKKNSPPHDPSGPVTVQPIETDASLAPRQTRAGRR
ncbi:MAG: hypothetical protein RLZZ524_260, partial [Pseudomonadota bacterium]